MDRLIKVNEVVDKLQKFIAGFMLPVVCCSISCTGGAKDYGNHGSDTISRADSIAMAEAERLAAEEAFQDSIRQAVFSKDSLAEKHILVDKEHCTLYVREKGETLMSVPVCLGKGIGQKKRQGDHKTPEGDYKIRSIENSSGWPYDFHDGKGKVLGAYGPWFFRLNTPQSTHIGIHGTLSAESVGTRDSDGCIRMRNEDLEVLRQHVSVGMKVIILPDPV